MPRRTDRRLTGRPVRSSANAMPAGLGLRMSATTSPTVIGAPPPRGVGVVCEDCPLGTSSAAARRNSEMVTGFPSATRAPPRTARRISELITQRRPDLSLPHVPGAAPDVHVAHCPECVLPGRIMIEIAANDRVIGGLTSACAAWAVELYRTFCRDELIITNAHSAEMAKLAENAFRDVNIAFANELSLICDRLGLDIWQIQRMANRHPQVEILRPGPGVGGHCIAVDPLVHHRVGARPGPADPRCSRGQRGQVPVHVAKRIVATSRRFREPRVACLGLSFKADVGDLRESPAVGWCITAGSARSGRRS